MATGKVWERQIEKLSHSDKVALHEAIKELSKWKFFDKEYGWTGYKSIGYMLERSLKMEEK